MRPLQNNSDKQTAKNHSTLTEKITNLWVHYNSTTKQSISSQKKNPQKPPKNKRRTKTK